MILNKTKQTGFIGLDVIMVIGIMLLIIAVALTLYGSARDKRNDQEVNYLGFIYHLSMSSGKGLIVYNEKEVSEIQKTVIRSLDCTKNYCAPLKTDLSIGAFISINYINDVAHDIKIYSTNVSSIFFKNNKSSYFYSDNFHLGKNTLDEHPDYAYALSIQTKVTHEYYLATDLNNPVSEDVCVPFGLDCYDVLHYKL
jgi:type II secretory pathway pseudopilin PulG